jgi:DNA-binding IscR family transcriptional regulator
MQDASTSLQALLELIESLDQLEVVLTLADEPARMHSTQELLDRTMVRPVDLSEVAKSLMEKGLVRVEEGGWRLTEDVKLASSVTELLRTYRENPLEIVAPVTNGAVERARAMTARALARAFLLRKQSG